MSESERGHGHCFRCRCRKAMVDPTETRLRNGKMAVTGRCVTCGVRIFRLLRESDAAVLEAGESPVQEPSTREV